MSIDKFDKGGCYKVTYSIQDFIEKQYQVAKDLSPLELFHYFNDITNEIIFWRITILCVFLSCLRFSRFQYQIPYKERHTHRGLH